MQQKEKVQHINRTDNYLEEYLFYSKHHLPS